MKKNNLSEVIKKVSDDDKRISGIDEKINVSGVNEKVSGNVIRRKVAGQIIGKEVINSSGMVVGKVKDIEVNWDNNEIEAIVFGKGGISESLGLSKEEVVIPYEEVEQFGDKILLKKNNVDKSSISDYYSYLERKIMDIE
jgi:sporulation protein YlmC with PRC-barrel domain